LEFKDSTKNANFLSTPSLDPILDNDIVEKKPFVDGPVVEDSYKASIVYCLMCLSNAYMELRHYSEAIECINESLEYAGDKVPDLYFRRAQAYYHNKFSGETEIKKAFEDVNKAISLKKETIYQELLEKLTALVEQRKKHEIDTVTSK
jgi:tetratricopeptide (TPR) repeat protein